MRFFRWFKLDSLNKIVKGGEVHAEDIDQALEKSREEGDCPRCEVWEGTRRVGLVE